MQANILLNPLLDLADTVVSHTKSGATVGLSWYHIWAGITVNPTTNYTTSHVILDYIPPASEYLIGFHDNSEQLNLKSRSLNSGTPSLFK